MGRPERPLDSVHDPIGEFAYDLRTLRRRAGNPSYRKLARLALFAPSVLSSAASGHRLPSLPVTLAFVAACGGEPGVWERRWRKLAAIQGPTPTQDGPAVAAASGAAPVRSASIATAPVDAAPAAVGSPASRASALSTMERAASMDVGGVALARPAQLPMGPSNFVGRDEALAGAVRVIAGTGGAVTTAVIISGPIGIGKTTFALRLADDLSAAFPDGQLYADLGGTAAGAPSAVTVVQGFLHALGVAPAHVPDDATQRIGLFRSLLAQRRVFVLLENAHDERQVRPLLGRSTSSQIVVTSRARLLGLDGVHRVDLDTFTRHESLTLIGRLAGVERIRAEHEAADTLADLCGNLPLAINIIGRRIAARPEWTVAALSGLLADAERVMTSLSVGDIRVRDCFASAYQRLTPAARHALHQLAHLGTAPARNNEPAAGAGTATAAGLAAAMGIAVDAADELLESLVDSGLLTRADRAGRYGVSTLVRAFAASTPHAARVPAAMEPRPDATAGRRMNLGHPDRLLLVRANAGKAHPARGDVVA